jgi:hypothetical protein
MGFLNAPLPPAIDPAAVANAQFGANDRAYQQNIQYGRMNQSGPFGATSWGTDPNTGMSTQTQTLSPELQSLYGQYFGNQGLRNNGLSSALGNANANAASGFNPTGLAPMVSNVASGTPYTRGVTPGGPLTNNVTPANLAGGFDRGGFQAIPGADNFLQERQNAEDALYKRATSRLDPQYGQAETALDTKLRNQGFQAGDTGADAAKFSFNQGKTDAYGQARNDAIVGGSAEQDRLLSNALRIRGQQNTEGQQDLTNYNSAGLATFGMGTTNAGLNNSAVGQDFGMGLSNANLNNASTSAEFSQGLSNANLSNAAHGQGYNEAASTYRMPFDVANSLQAGSTPMNPSLGNGMSGATPAGAPNMSSLYNSQYDQQLNQRNSDQAFNNGLLNAAGNFATGALGAGGAGVAGAAGNAARGALGGSTSGGGGFGGAANNSAGNVGGTATGGGGGMDSSNTDFSGIGAGQVGGGAGGGGADAGNMDFSNLSDQQFQQMLDDPNTDWSSIMGGGNTADDFSWLNSWGT